MEFNEYLTRIQGILVTLNRTNGLRREPTHIKGGIKEKSALYKALQKVLVQCKDNESEMRNTHLYLLFNADFSFNEEVANEDDFCHIVNSAPTIDRQLLVETVLALNWHNFIYETIVFSHISISLEYLETLLHGICLEKPLKDIFTVENIITAVNKRLSHLANEMNPEDKEFSKSRSKLSFYFREFLKAFSPPHGENEMGYVIKSLLSLLQSCIQQQYNIDTEIDEKYKIYSLSLSNFEVETTNVDYLDFEKIILSVVKMLEENLNLINLSVWMSWSECKWQPQVDLQDISKTMQQVIGEQAFLCKQELQRLCDDIPEVATLSAVLTHMEIKPITDEDEIEMADDINQIISKVNDANRASESRKKWLIALLKFSWHLKEEQCVNCLQEFGDLLDSLEDILLLQKKVGEILSGVSVSHPAEPCSIDMTKEQAVEISEPLKGRMKKIVFEAYPRISAENQGKLVGTFFKEFGLIDCFHTGDIEKRITETLNKVVNVNDIKDQLISDICVLCLQSPVEVLKRLLVLGIGCHTQIGFVVDALKVLSLVCQLHVIKQLPAEYTKQNAGVKNALLCYQLSILIKQNSWNETENSNVLHLVAQCLESSVLLLENLLNDCIIPGLEECVENLSWNSINMYVEILNTVLTMPSSSLENISNPAAMLAYILSILEKGKFHMRKKFSVPASSTCELTTTWIPVLLGKMLDQATFTENDLNWLRNRVLLASPQCQYNYNKLWPVPSNTTIKDYQSLIMLSIYNDPEFNEKKMLDLLTKDNSLLCHFLFKLLPSCTTSEWLNVASVLKSIIPKATEIKENLYWHLFHKISSALLIMIMVVKIKVVPEDKNALYCIELWFKNYVRIIKEEFWPWCKYFNIDQATDIFMTIVRILEDIPEAENIRETCSFLALNILSEIVEAALSQNSKDGISKNGGYNPCLNKLVACISLMSEGEHKKGLARKVIELSCK